MHHHTPPNYSTIDHLFHFMQISSKFFAGGFSGTCQPDCLSKLFQMRKYIMDKQNCNQLLRQFYPTEIKLVKNHSDKHFKIYDGQFLSPFAAKFPEFAPEPIATCRFQMILPNNNNNHSTPYLTTSQLNNSTQPMCIQLAGTGDHYFWRRRLLMAKPLAKNNNVGSILLENPYYGLRKPNYQNRSSLRNVTDLFIMGGCLVLESLVLLDWCEKQGFGPLGLTGISMGGHMCSLAACSYEKPVALVPCLSWSTASCVFTQGVLSDAVAWKTLQNQYFSDDFRRRESLILSALEENLKVSNTSGEELTFPTAPPIEVTQNNNQTISLSWLLKWNLLNAYIFNANRNWHNNKNNKKLITLTRRNDVSRFLHKILDEFTHLALFSKPVDPSLIIVVCALMDAYVPRDNVSDLQQIWPEAEFRFLEKQGHIGAFLFEQAAFRKAIVDALNKMAQKSQQIKQAEIPRLTN